MKEDCRYKTVKNCKYTENYPGCFDGTKNLCYNSNKNTYTNYTQEAQKYYGNYTKRPQLSDCVFQADLFYKPKCGRCNYGK